MRKDDVKDFIAKDTYSLQDKPGLVYSNLSYEALEQYDRSLTAFNRAIVLNPEDFTIYVQRGDTLFQAKRYIEAIESYSQGIALNPNHPWA